MLTFATAVFLLIISPGPGVLTAAGVGSAFGYRAGIHYVFGLFVGNFLVSLAVITGVAAALFSIPYLRSILMAVTTAYLLYLAYRIATSGNKVAFIEAKNAPGFKTGLMLQFINPKAYAVSTVLFTSFAFMPENISQEIILKIIIFNLIWIPIHLLWLHLGVSLRRLNLSDRTQRRINSGMAACIVGVVILSIHSMIN